MDNYISFAPSDENKTELMQKYLETGNVDYRNRLVLAYMDIVKFVSLSLRNAYSRYGDTADIVNEGVIGLIGAIETFKPEKGVKFETYANIKVRGTIIDYIRKQDFVPRNIRRFSKDLEAAHTELYKELGHQPSNEELSEKMGIPVPQLERNMADSVAAVTISFEELLFEDNFDKLNDDGIKSASSDREMYEKEQTRIIAEAISALKPREKEVVKFYYYDKLKFAEIAEIMGVSESRICQMHSKCMLFLKQQLHDYLKG